MCLHEMLTAYLHIMCDLFLISSLSKNKISDDGALALSEMLKVNQSLKDLM